MINVQEAIKRSLDYAKGFYGRSIDGILLEEIELVDETNWIITLSFYLEESSNPATRTFGILTQQNRRFKQFKINAESGDIVSMKIREFNE